MIYNSECYENSLRSKRIRDPPGGQRFQLGKHFRQGRPVPTEVPQAGPHEPDGAAEQDDARPHRSDAALQPREADVVSLVPHEQEPLSFGGVRVKCPEILLHRDIGGIPGLLFSHVVRFHGSNFFA